jgi:LysM repeat protein
MTKPSASSATAPRLCPTCGTRVGAAATKCLVCGADLTVANGARAGGRVRAAAARGLPLRMPSPLVLVLLAVLILIAIGATLFVNGAFNQFLPSVGPTATPTLTPTSSPPPTFTPSATATDTPEPTGTPLPPVEYKVVQNDTCLKIAASFNVSYQSIIQLNKLDPNCTLSVGQTLQIPQPTPTPTTLPTATLPAGVVTQVPRTTYTVHSGDTLQGIARFYGVSVADLMEVNGISDPAKITVGLVLIIPLERVVTPGPTPTATAPPPWPAPNQLLPADGHIFTAADLTVTLQWTSVGTLRTNEYYYVVVEDVTCNCASFVRQATTETKFILPGTARPVEATTHIYRWTVTTVRQTSPPGSPAQYEPAGATSPSRVFSWEGGATPAP